MNRRTINKAVVRDVPMGTLVKLHELFDELAVTIDWSRDNGELIVRVGDTFELEMTADPDELNEIAEDMYWADDAQALAEGFWRE